MSQTEVISSRYADLDDWEDLPILDALVGGQERAVAAVRSALPAIAAASGPVVERLRSGGRLIYAGAGSSAGIAVQDGSELPGTFGLSQDDILFLIAGGERALTRIDGAAEDDEAQGQADVAALGDLSRDVMIAVSASGRTRYTVAAAQAARSRGALVVSVANNAGSPLLALAACPILLESGAEVIAGSTRMGAGTAQKCALGLLSTLVATRLGHVHAGMMVGVKADNEKLRQRSQGIVSSITGAAPEAANAALARAGGDVKVAILLCAGAGGSDEAKRLLTASQGRVRGALERLSQR